MLVASLLLVVAAAAFGAGVFGGLSNGGFDDPGSDSAKVATVLEEEFPSGQVDLVAIYRSDTQVVTDPAFQEAVTDTIAGLPTDAVASTTTWYATQAPGLISEDRHATRVLITLRGADQDARKTATDAVIPLLEAPGLRTEIGGQWSVFNDVNVQVTRDIARAESIAIPIVLLLSLLIFGSVAAALMPTFVGAIAVAGAFAVVRAVSELTEISIFSINVITLLGMGLAIDYALFVVGRFREELAHAPTTDREHVRAAVRTTLTTAGRTVLFSSLVVAGSMSSLLVFPQVFLRSMAIGAIAAVLVAAAASLTVLPALLGVLGHRIELGTMPWRRRAGHAAPRDGSPMWGRIADAVMRRPVLVLLASIAVLAALSSPFLGARFGGIDERVLPPTSASRIAADVQRDWFGVPDSTAEVVLTGAQPTQAADYEASLRAVSGVSSVGPATTGPDGHVLTTVRWSMPPQGEQSQQLVRELRSVPAPEGVTAMVGGQTAQTVDMIDSLRDRLPWMAAIVIALMLVLLFIAFGSIVLPIKAVVVAALSIGASFGAITWVFQDGHLSDLLGFTSPGYLDATQPILILAMLFGLSMDYEVFLLSRMREEWDRTHDNRRAIRVGLQRTGTIITSAALLLGVVVGGFGTSGIVFLKMIGLGILVALLMDATLVRGLLVPAAMHLLGTANWWAPGPLARWWRRHGHRSDTEAHPAPTSGRRTPVGAAPR